MRMFIESDFAGAGRAMRLRDDGHRPPVDGRRGFQAHAAAQGRTGGGGEGRGVEDETCSIRLGTLSRAGAGAAARYWPLAD